MKEINQNIQNNPPASAKRKKVSRYRSKYCRMLLDMFTVPLVRTFKEEKIHKDGSVSEIRKEIPVDLPLLESFADSINVHVDELFEWAERFPEFANALKKAEQKQHIHFVRNTLRGNYNVWFAVFFAKNALGWKDVKFIRDRSNSPEHQTNLFKEMMRASGFGPKANLDPGAVFDLNLKSPSGNLNDQNEYE